MVLADYTRIGRDENGRVASSNSIDNPNENNIQWPPPSSSTTRGGDEQLQASTTTSESRTRYGSEFATITTTTTNETKKKSNYVKSKFIGGRERFKKNNTKPPPMIGDMVCTPMNYLTTKQRRRIVETWKSITDRKLIGQRIYMQVFMHKPSLKAAAVKCQHLSRWIFLVSQTLFSFRDVPIDQLKNNAYFNRQSTIFADFLHTVVSFVQLNSENLLKDLCHRMGVRHAQFTSLDFEPDWWRTFIEAALDCLHPYFPPCRTSSSRGRFNSSGLVGQLPFIGHWLRESYKQAWTTLLEHAVQLMSEAFTNYRTRRCGQGGDDQTITADRGGGDIGRRFGIYTNFGGGGSNSRDQEEEDDDQVELQLVIVTTPVEDYVTPDEDDRKDLDIGAEQTTQDIVDDIGDDESYSISSMRNTTTAPSVSVMTTSFSLQQPIPPRSWETTRKHVLRLNSLEDWDLQD